MARFEAVIEWLGERISWFSLAGLVVMMFLTVIDVIGRYVFSQPITGTLDLTGLIALVIVSAALGKTQIRGGHVSVDFLIVKFRGRFRSVVVLIGSIISLAVFITILWRSIVYGIYWLRIGEVTQTIKIPFWPFAFVLAIGTLHIGLVLLLSVIKSAIEVFKK